MKKSKMSILFLIIALQWQSFGVMGFDQLEMGDYPQNCFKIYDGNDVELNQHGGGAKSRANDRDVTTKFQIGEQSADNQVLRYDWSDCETNPVMINGVAIEMFESSDVEIIGTLGFFTIDSESER